jgi:hypothetical protein
MLHEIAPSIRRQGEPLKLNVHEPFIYTGGRFHDIDLYTKYRSSFASYGWCECRREFLQSHGISERATAIS